MDEPPDIDWVERNNLKHQIYRFRQHEESLTDSWVKFQELLKNCYEHGLNRMEQVITFYEGLNSDSKNYLDLAGEGDFYYMSPNEVYRVMEDLVKFEEYRLSPNIYESGLYADRNEEPNENQAELYITTSKSIDPLRCSEVSNCSSQDFQYPSASQPSHEESEGVVEYCLKFDKERRKPEAEIKDEEPKRAEKIIRHTEMKAYTIEFEYEDSDDEDWFEEVNEVIVEKNMEEEIGKIEKEEDLTELETVSPMNVKIEEEDSQDEEFFNELFELLMNDNAEECVGDEEPEVLELETVSPIDENEKGLECLETVFPNKVIKDVIKNPVEEMVKGHFDPFVEKRVVEEEELEKIDPEPNDGLNGKNCNIIDKSFVIGDFDLQDPDSVVKAYDSNAEFLEVFGKCGIGLMGVLEELDTGGVEHLYFDPFDEIRVTKEEEPTEIAFDPDPKDDEKDIEAEIRELIGDDSEKGFRELKGIDIESLTAENLDEFLCGINEPEPKEETKGKTNSDFVDSCVSSILLIPRKKARGAYLKRKKRNVRCEFGIFLMPMLILGCTRKWVDAIVKIFEKLFVANEFCDLIAWFCLTNSYHSLI